MKKNARKQKKNESIFYVETWEEQVQELARETTRIADIIEDKLGIILYNNLKGTQFNNIHHLEMINLMVLDLMEKTETIFKLKGDSDEKCYGA